MKMESFEVEAEQEGERLDKFLSIIYPEFSRAFFQKLIKSKQVSVNETPQKASYCVKIDDIVTVEIPDAVETTIEPENIPLEELELSVRSYNCLKRAGMNTLREVSEMTFYELCNVRNLGKRSIDEICAALTNYGIRLKKGGE